MSTPDLDEGSYVKVRRAIPVTLVYRANRRLCIRLSEIPRKWPSSTAIQKKNTALTAIFKSPSRRQKIVIGNVSRKTITEDDVVPYAVESIPDENLGRGKNKLSSRGKTAASE